MLRTAGTPRWLRLVASSHVIVLVLWRRRPELMPRSGPRFSPPLSEHAHRGSLVHPRLGSFRARSHTLRAASAVVPSLNPKPGFTAPPHGNTRREPLSSCGHGLAFVFSRFRVAFSLLFAWAFRTSPVRRAPSAVPEERIHIHNTSQHIHISSSPALSQDTASYPQHILAAQLPRIHILRRSTAHCARNPYTSCQFPRTVRDTPSPAG